MIDLAGIDPAHHDGMSQLADDMHLHGYQRHEPVREVFGLLGDRWSTLILLVLAIGIWRHAELQRAIGRLGAEGKISQRMLTLKLRTLERDGLVLRHVTGHIPPRVSYELTSLGRELLNEVRKLIGWIGVRRVDIEAARKRFDILEAD